VVLSEQSDERCLDERRLDERGLDELHLNEHAAAGRVDVVQFGRSGIPATRLTLSRMRPPPGRP
jgi:hypothetical protein